MKSASLSLPRVYLDSDVLIKAKIETLPELKDHPELTKQRTEAKDEIPAASELLSLWNPSRLLVSVYTLMETLNCAIRTYRLPLERVGPLLAESCRRDFSVVFADFELVGREGSVAEIFENSIPESAIYGSVRIQGQAVGPDGNRIGPISQGV